MAEVKEDIYRAKNAIDLVTRDIHQKRQVSIGLAAELADCKGSVAELDQQLEQRHAKFETVTDEVAALDEEIARHTKILNSRDGEVERLSVNLKEVEQRKRDEEETFKQQLLQEAQRRQQRDWYVPVPGNTIDEQFAEHVNSCVHSVGVQRLGNDSYMYGSKKIHAKIMNDKLVIRVGGGFMLIDEFLPVYGQQELDKIAQR